MKILKIREHKELILQVAEWFHDMWEIPLEAYEESMRESLKKDIPQWYVVVENGSIIGGAGVIENDFHNRKDLTPNICALYVDEKYRCRGIAGKLLEYICNDMKKTGIKNIYLITDHTSFYERYGWKYLCMVQGDDEPEMIRMYSYKL